MNWRAVFAIARKDIVDAVRNQYILFGLLLPIGMSLLFRLILLSPEDLGGTLSVAVYDPGGSRLVAALRAVPQVQVLDVRSGDQLAAEVEKNAVGGLAVPSGFDAAVAAGEHPELTVYLNRRRGGGALAAYQSLIDKQVWALVDQPAPAQIVWQDVGNAPGLQPAGQLNLETYLFVQFLVLGLAMTGALMVPMLLVEEKEKHTLAALLLSPAGPAEVAVGKGIAGASYSLLVAAILIVLNRGWLGNWPVTVLAIVLGTALTVVIGLLLGGLLRTGVQVNTWSGLVLVAMIMPSLVPMIQMPAALETAFRLIPTYYLVDMLGLAAAGQATLAGIWLDIAVLAGSTLVALAFVIWTLRRDT